VDDPVQPIFITRFDGKDVSSVPDGDELVLEKGLPFFLDQHLVEDLLTLSLTSLSL